MTWGAIGGAAVGVVGGALANKGAKSQTSTQTQQLDPRAQGHLWGLGSDPGMVTTIRGLGNAGQNKQLTDYEQGNLNYLSTAPGDMLATRDAAMNLLQGNQAPQIGGAAWAQGSMVDAPKQNNMDLSGSYNSFINGERGNNPYLTGAIQKGINQSSNAFGNMVTDAKAATQDVLGSVRGGAIGAGMFGSSRQGIAEGKAIESMNTNLARAASQFGQNNTDAAVAAQAGAYDADSNRALNATQGLGAQQYGVASQNANTKNQAEFMNVQQANNNYKDNALLQMQGNAANQSAAMAGAGLLAGQQSSAYNAGQNQDAYALNKQGKASGIMAPYLTSGGTQTSSQPLYQNQGANLLGGAAAGLGIANGLQGLWGGAGIGANNGMGTGNNYNFTPTPLSTNPAALQNLNFFGG